MISCDLFQIRRIVQCLQINKCHKSHQQNKGKNHIVVMSIDAEKAADKIQQVHGKLLSSL